MKAIDVLWAIIKAPITESDKFYCWVDLSTLKIACRLVGGSKEDFAIFDDGDDEQAFYRKSP